MKADSTIPGNWQSRHNDAVADRISVYSDPDKSRRPFETAIVRLLDNWQAYALDHQTQYDSLIGDDGVLGPHWRDIGLGIRGLLNGDCGPRLDCGTLDGFILDTLKENGIDTEQL